jgi:hypothetical protein
MNKKQIMKLLNANIMVYESNSNCKYPELVVRDEKELYILVEVEKEITIEEFKKVQNFHMNLPGLSKPVWNYKTNKPEDPLPLKFNYALVVKNENFDIIYNFLKEGYIKNNSDISHIKVVKDKEFCIIYDFLAGFYGVMGRIYPISDN